MDKEDDVDSSFMFKQQVNPNHLQGFSAAESKVIGCYILFLYMLYWFIIQVYLSLILNDDKSKKDINRCGHGQFVVF